jgi:hypothetical protein
VTCRVSSGSSDTYTVSPLDRNWCNRNANNGRLVPGCRAFEPASRTERIAATQVCSSSSVRPASSRAARVTVVGLRRSSRPVPSSVSRPKVSSTQTASGSPANCGYDPQAPDAAAADTAARSAPTAAVPTAAVPTAAVPTAAGPTAAGPTAAGPSGGAAPDEALVARSRVSPITRSGVTSEPNKRVATSATTCFWLATLPPDAIVAEVPITCRSADAHTSRNRRISRATSAPCRPRQVCSSSRTRKLRPWAARIRCLRSSGRVSTSSSIT